MSGGCPKSRWTVQWREEHRVVHHVQGEHYKGQFYGQVHGFFFYEQDHSETCILGIVKARVSVLVKNWKKLLNIKKLTLR